MWPWVKRKLGAISQSVFLQQKEHRVLGKADVVRLQVQPQLVWEGWGLGTSHRHTEKPWSKEAAGLCHWQHIPNFKLALLLGEWLSSALPGPQAVWGVPLGPGKPSGCSPTAWGLHRAHHSMPRARSATGVLQLTHTDTAGSGARWLLAKTCRSQYLGFDPSHHS